SRGPPRQHRHGRRREREDGDGGRVPTAKRERRTRNRAEPDLKPQAPRVPSGPAGRERNGPQRSCHHDEGAVDDTVACGGLVLRLHHRRRQQLTLQPRHSGIRRGHCHPASSVTLNLLQRLRLSSIFRQPHHDETQCWTARIAGSVYWPKLWRTPTRRSNRIRFLVRCDIRHKPFGLNQADGGGGNRTRVHDRTKRASTSVFRDFVSPGRLPPDGPPLGLAPLWCPGRRRRRSPFRLARWMTPAIPPAGWRGRRAAYFLGGECEIRFRTCGFQGIYEATWNL